MPSPRTCWENDVAVLVVEDGVAVRPVAVPPAPGSRDQEPAPGHGLHGDVPQGQLADPGDRDQARIVDRDAGCHRPGGTGIGEGRSCGAESPRCHCLEVTGCGPHRDGLAGGSGRGAHHDVTRLAFDDAMVAERQDREAHHFVPPRLLPPPELLLPFGHAVSKSPARSRI